MTTPNPQINRNLEAPPFRIPLYDDAPRNTIMNSTWVRWLQGVYDRVGGPSGGLIYDNATASQDLSSLEPQLYAIKAEIENQFTGILLSIIEQVQEQFTDQSALLQDTSAALLQLVENQNILESGNAGFVQQTLDSLGTVNLNSVLTAGNTSTLGLTTGDHIIQGAGNLSLSMSSTGQDWWLAYNASSNVFGVYDNTGSAFRMYFADGTGNMTVSSPETRFENQVLIGYPADTGQPLIVDGNIKATGSFVGDGSALTSLNASQLTSGTLPSARLPSSGVVAGTYHYTSVDVDSTGRVTGIATNPVVEYVVAGSGISVSAATGGVTITNTSPSDYRLKDNIVDLVDIERFDNLRPVRFNFKDEPSKTVDGFIAHELQDAVPEAVFGEKDGEKMQHISVQQVIPLLTAVVKDQRSKIATLEAEINEIKAILARLNS
jgi:hypothetical protein